MNKSFSPLVFLALTATLSCGGTKLPSEEAGTSITEQPKTVASARGTLEWEPETSTRAAMSQSATRELDALGYSGGESPDTRAAQSSSRTGNLARREGNPLLSNVIFEVQGPLNGPTLGFLANQYYLSSTIEWGALSVGSAGAHLQAAAQEWAETYWAHASTPAKAGKPSASKSKATTWKPATSAVNATQLSIGDNDELPLQGIEATVWVDGFRARVLLDCIYENDRPQQLEGKFKLRLPEGAKPYYLAFGEETPWRARNRKVSDRSLSTGPEPESVLDDREDRWRGAREARMVPRKQAARAYQNTRRRAVDPALMEWTGAGIFQARVFPLLPETSHRVVVGYEVDLVAVAGSPGEYELALSLPDDLPALSMDLHVLAPRTTEVSIEPSAQAQSTGVRRSYSYSNTDSREFKVRVPGLTRAALTSPDDGGFFAMDLTPELESAPIKSSPAAVFLVDTSLSSADGRYPIWLDLMESILEQNSDSIEEFAVLFFDVAPRWWRAEATTNTSSAREALREYAESLALEGASDLGAALSEAHDPSWLPRGWSGERDLFLLSDGDSNWGASDVDLFVADARGGQAGSIYAYTTGLAGTSVRTLAKLTRQSGGAMYSVNGASAIASAAMAHTSVPWRIEGVRAPDTSDLLLRGLPTAIFPGQSLRVVGRGVPAPGSALELELSRDGVRKTLRFEIEHALETTLAVRAYGVVATDQLEELGAPLRDVAAAYATRFRVPGKSCSLLMLESNADYANQGIIADPEALERSSAWPAAEVVSARDASGGRGPSPAQRLIDQATPLVELSHIPALDEELIARLRALPDEALVIGTERVAFESLLASSVSSDIKAALATRFPDYQLIRDESARRAEELALGDAVRLASSLVELNPGDALFVRDVAQTLMQWGLFGHAYHLHQRVMELRPHEPDSILSLARCAAEAGQADLAMFWFTVVVRGEWAARAGEINRVAAFEASNLLRKLDREGRVLELTAPLVASREELIQLVGLEQADLAVVIQWNTNATDIDLHVREPRGGHCYYGNRSTRLGGSMSQDVTQGFGPELYIMKTAPAGNYEFFVQYFAGNQNRTQVQSRVLATVYQDWGTENEVTARRQIELDVVKEEKSIAKLSLGVAPTVLTRAVGVSR